MTKYIKCDEDFIDRAMRACGPCTTAVIGITELLEQEVGADVTETKYGYWIYHADDLFPNDSTQECSVCHEDEYLTLCNENYCPNCGAAMKGVQKNA